MAYNYTISPGASTTTSSGSSGGTAITVGSMDSFAGVAFGATASASAIYLQSASATVPGLINNTSQVFSGIKTFDSLKTRSLSVGSSSFTQAAGGVAYSLAFPATQSSSTQYLANDGLGNMSWGTPTASLSGSVSLTNQVSGLLPLAQTSGSLSLTNQVNGILPFSSVSGSVSLSTQVSGILPFSSVSGSVSLVNQVSGFLPLTQTTGSVSLVDRVVGNLPLSQTSGSVSLTNQASGVLPLANMSSTSGSVTFTSSAGGVAYTLTLPGTQASASSTLINDGLGNMSWQQNPGCRYVTGSGTTYTSGGTLGSLTFVTKVWDTHSAYNTVTGDFLVPERGIYQVNTGCNVQFSAEAATDSTLGIAIVNNGVMTSLYNIDTALGQTQQGASISDLVICSAGHKISVKYFSNATGSSLLDSSTQNYLSIQKVGE